MRIGRIAAIAWLLIVLPRCGSTTGFCTGRSRPVITVTHHAAWVPDPIGRIEISEDRTIAIGPFDQGCPRCASLGERELRRLEMLARNLTAQSDVRPFLNGACQVLDTPALTISIDDRKYSLCNEQIPSAPALARFLEEIERTTQRHFPDVSRRMPLQRSDNRCEALRANTRRTWECRQVFPWRDRPVEQTATAGRINATLSLAVEPRETLPGLPLTLRIAMTNDGAAAIPIPQFVAVEVTPEHGEPFMAIAGDPAHAEYRQALYYGPQRRLGPHETASLDLDAGAGWQYGFSELTCLESGRYRLRLIADANFAGDRPGPHALTLREPWLTGPVSNEADLTVVAPQGVDSDAWKLARRRGPFWWVGPFPELWQRYPDSAYTAYGVPLRLDEKDDHRAIIELYGAALRHQPRGMFADDYRLRIAEAHRIRALCFALRNDTALARAEKQAAREQLLAVSKLSALASYQLGTVLSTPERLADFYGYALAGIGYARSQMAAKGDERVIQAMRALDDMTSALNAVPPDETRALSLLVNAIRELIRAPGAGREPWMDALLNGARSFATNAFAGSAADSVLREAETQYYAKDFAGTFAALEKALAQLEAAPKPPQVDCFK